MRLIPSSLTLNLRRRVTQSLSAIPVTSSSLESESELKWVERIQRDSGIHGVIYGNRDIAYLVKKYFLLSLCKNKIFSSNAHKIFAGSKTVLGNKGFEMLFKPYVYNMFIAGETSLEISRVMSTIQNSQMIPLLSPMQEENPEDHLERVSMIEKNIGIVKQCIELYGLEEFNQLRPKAIAMKYTSFIRTSDLESLTSLMRNQDLESCQKILHRVLRDSSGKWKLFQQGVKDMRELCAMAREARVTLFIDAEFTHIQPAIRQLTNFLVPEFNSKQVVIANTQQCYLKTSLQEMKEDFAWISKHKDIQFGVKLVRGAYMEHENGKSLREKEPSPIFPSYKQTCDNYDQVASFLIGNARQDDFILIATHNENSVLKCLDLMSTLGLTNKNKEADEKLTPKHVHFAQLKGMGDNLSKSLAANDVSILKLIPVGNVTDVLPFLSRRMQENRDAFLRTEKDRELVGKELWRRLTFA